MLPDQSYDLPTTYRLSGQNLLRRQMLDTTGTSLETVVATRITSFQVTQSGDTVDVSVSSTSRDNKTVFTESISVNLRN